MNNDCDWLVEEDNSQSEYNALKRNLLKSGYRDGITDGQEYILQTAFNEGFNKAKLFYGEMARYRGFLSALMMYIKMKSLDTPETVTRCEQIIDGIETYENNDFEFFRDTKTAYKNPPTIRAQKDISNEDIDNLAKSFSHCSDVNLKGNQSLSTGFKDAKTIQPDTFETNSEDQLDAVPQELHKNDQIIHEIRTSTIDLVKDINCIFRNNGLEFPFVRIFSEVEE